MNRECLNTKYALISQNILVRGETGFFQSLIHLSDAYMYNILLSPLCRDLKENYEI